MMRRDSMMFSAAWGARAALLALALVSLAPIANAAALDDRTVKAGSPSSSAAVDLGAEYRLSIGDKVAVTVFGQTDLTGEYLVDGYGNITLPLAGAIQVAGSTLKTCEQRIAARLQDGYIREPSISVRISEPRPIYVVGDVKLPGTYPYRYGSTVLSAIAVAGGYGVAEVVPGTAASEFLVSDERVNVLERSRALLLLRKARITAQLEGKDTFDPPALPNVSLSTDQINAAIENERQVLTEQRQARAKEINLQQQQKPIIQATLESTLKQTEGERKQLALVNDQYAEYSKLDKLGLSRRVNEIAIKREMAALESSIAKLDADRSRLDLMSGEVDIKIQDIELAYERRCLLEMQEVRTKLAEIEASLPSARELRALRSQQAGGLIMEGAEASRTLSILRTRDGSAETLPATASTLLQPGDIVEVKRMRPSVLTDRELVAGQSSPSISMIDDHPQPRPQ